MHKVSNVVAFEIASQEAFSLTVNVDTGVGFAQYEFDCRLRVVEDGTRLQVEAVGTNAHNVVEFTVAVTLQENGENTEVHAQIEAAARGGLASVAQRTVCGVIVRHVQDWLNEALQGMAAIA